MDIITHGLLGAVAAQATYGSRLGRRAATIGALAGIFPDIDVFSFFSTPFVAMAMHRGFTHSLWFPFLMGPILGLIYWHWRQIRREHLSLDGCMGAAFWGILSHGFLDVCTAYGTQLFAPFSNHRFALNAISIVDILYTFLLGVSIILALLFTKYSKMIARYGIILTTSYLFFGFLINETMTSEIQQKQPSIKRVWVSPTLRQLFYRRIILSDPDQVCIGYHHFMYPEEDIKYVCRPRSRDLRIEILKKTQEGQLFQWFADDLTFEWIEETQEGSLALMSDVRFGFSLDPEETLWGIFVHFDKEHKQSRPVESYRNLGSLSTLKEAALRYFAKGYLYPYTQKYTNMQSSIP